MMTIFFPDVSHFTPVTIEPGTVAVVSKATHGFHFKEASYLTFQAQAKKQNAYYVAYHWLNHGDASAQANYCYATVGKTPLMIDAEDVPGNTGYNGYLTVDDILAFVAAFRELGGVVHLCYLPQWYWSLHMGHPDLTPLQEAGVWLVSSNYTTYSDSGPGWATYGGCQPVVWQYTDALPYGGGSVDFNAFKGTLDEFKQLVGGTNVMPAFDDWNPLFHDGVQRSPSTVLKEIWEGLFHGDYIDGVHQAPLGQLFANAANAARDANTAATRVVPISLDDKTITAMAQQIAPLIGTIGLEAALENVLPRFRVDVVQ
jgi:hypothetical protein